jgi:hypothetical protein
MRLNQSPEPTAIAAAGHPSVMVCPHPTIRGAKPTTEASRFPSGVSEN